MTIKKRHHYIWRNYLRPWSSEDYIWCLRDAKVFNSNLMNIGQIKYFYKLKDINERDYDFLERFIDFISPAALKTINRGWLESFTLVFQIKKRIEIDEINNVKLTELLEKTICNLEENLHSGIEGESIIFLDSLLQNDASFFNTDEGCMSFLHYICVQYMRTRKIKENCIDLVGDTGVVDFEKIWNILSHVMITNLSWNLYSKKDTLQLVLLKNISDIEIITGDQPVINTYASGIEKTKSVDKLELYYPISPKLSILIRDGIKGESQSICEKSITDSEVENYNLQIIEHSHSQIYASTEANIRKYE